MPNVLIKRIVMFFLLSMLKEWLNHDTKLNSILRWQYHNIHVLLASWKKMYSGIGRSRKVMEHKNIHVFWCWEELQSDRAP